MVHHVFLGESVSSFYIVFTKASVTHLEGSNKPMDCLFQFSSPVLIYFINMNKIQSWNIWDTTVCQTNPSLLLMTEKVQ